jgi:peroxiredoxin
MIGGVGAQKIAAIPASNLSRMDEVVLAARAVLVVVFATAAIGKLLDLAGSRASLVGFGVPERLAAYLGTALPFAELAVAIALIPRPTAQWGAVGALVLLLAFITGIANAMRNGEAPSCNCFGVIHSAPAGKETLARNVVLAAIAAVAVGWGPGPAIDSWIDARSAADLVAVGAGIAAVLLLGAATSLWVENRRLRGELSAAEGRLRKIPAGIRVGSLAPEFSLPDGEGGNMRLSSLLSRGRPVALVFTAAGCGPCDSMVPELRHLQRIASDRITVAMVGINTIERYDRARQEHGGDLLLTDALEEDPGLRAELDQLTKVFQTYQVPHSPSAVIVSPEGTIASTTVSGRLAIEALIRRTMAGAVAPMRTTSPVA